MSSTLVGFLAGTGTTISFAPQMVYVVRSKKVDSPFTFFIHSSGVALWVVYGVLVQNVVIIVFNALTLFMNLVILGVFFKTKTIVSEKYASPRSPTDLAEARRRVPQETPQPQPQGSIKGSFQNV